MSKEDLNLPKTSFSMKANLPHKEPSIVEFWDKINLYKQLREQSKGKEKFILHDGPPYANGYIHMGTALNKILKDVVTRFHQMNGKDSNYVPGWDCHGLPIEWKIEEQYKKDKKNKDEVPISEFRKECREFANKWIDVQKKEFKRLGVIGDWENYYSTMSFDAEASIVRELGKFLLEGSLYKGFKPVLWSTVEKTALADAEVEYKDHTSNTIYVGFKVESSKIKILNESQIIIWTTTPWTIPANRALAYNKNLDYTVIEINDSSSNFNNQKIVVASKLLDTIIKGCELKKYKKIDSFKGEDFKETICSHPFKDLGYEYQVPMLDAQFVTLEQGTGIVHCAPSHGPDDFNLCLKHGIKSVDTIDDNGRYTKYIPKFEGIHIFKADEIIIEKLKECKKLLSNGKLTHSYPHSWRSKAPLVHRATPQWFISMESHKLRNIALKAIDETKFYPRRGKIRIRSMIETRPDWCVSRQRVWGVPLPIFISKKTGEPLKERKDRVEDALNSTRAAVEEGVVVGGGCALLYASQDLDKVKVKGADQKAGVAIVKKTLQAPIRQICANAAVDGSVIVGKLLEANKLSRGYDAQAEEYCDMFEKGIIDPAKVVKTALQDAASIAGLLVMTEAMVAEKPEEKDSAAGGMPPGGMGGMGGGMGGMGGMGM